MQIKKIIKHLIALSFIAILGCACILCGCHVFAWYIPKEYNDKQMAEIYSYLNDPLLTDLPHYIANISYPDPDENGHTVSVNMWNSEDKIIFNFDKFEEESGNIVKLGVWYDGTLKEYDKVTGEETVTEKDISEYDFLFDWLRQYAHFLKTNVVGIASYSDDSYCWECFPWGFGMAQIYYNDIDGARIYASWNVEKYGKIDELPLIHDAEFSYSTERYGIKLELYGSAYGIDERINNILNNYEEGKLLPNAPNDPTQNEIPTD